MISAHGDELQKFDANAAKLQHLTVAHKTMRQYEFFWHAGWQAGGGSSFFLSQPKV